MPTATNILTRSAPNRITIGYEGHQWLRGGGKVKKQCMYTTVWLLLNHDISFWVRQIDIRLYVYFKT